MVAISSHRATHSSNTCGVSSGARRADPGPPASASTRRLFLWLPGATAGVAPPGGQRKQRIAAVARHAVGQLAPQLAGLRRRLGSIRRHPGGPVGSTSRRRSGSGHTCCGLDWRWPDARDGLRAARGGRAGSGSAAPPPPETAPMARGPRLLRRARGSRLRPPGARGGGGARNALGLGPWP